MGNTQKESITYFARVRHRHNRTPFGIKHSDRLSHIYVIGKTGSGKSTLLETMASQDLTRGSGFALVDPHGDLAERVAKQAMSLRKRDLIYFNVPDRRQPFGYNPLANVARSRRPLAASGLLDVFKKMWSDAWGNKMENLLRNALLALLDYPDATLADLLVLLRDEKFRREVLEHVENDQVRDYWLKEFDKYPQRFRAETIAPIQNKVGAFLANPILHHVLVGPDKPLNLRKIMDDGKILVLNLAKGQIGEDSAGLLGGLLLTSMGLAAFSRAEVSEERRRDFYIYIDEFQMFTTLALANMIAELRKYHVGLILANQYLYQLEPPIRHAVLGNAGTLISFRLGAEDASFIAKEFQPKFEPVDLLNLPNYHIYLKLMIDGAPSKPFSAVTVTPAECM